MENETINIHAGSVDELVRKCKAILEEEGYIVIKDSESKWETPKQYADKMGLNGGTVCRLLRLPECPHFEARRGDTGRLRLLRANPNLDMYVLRYKTDEK